MRSPHFLRSYLLWSVFLAGTCGPVLAHAATFSDLPATSPYASAADYLKEKGVIGGYADGTFRPEAKVNRAEALKLLLGADVAATDEAPVFSDTPAGSWYLPFIRAALTKGIIAGPPAKTVFLPGNPVRKGEFLKMLVHAYGEDPNAYGEVRLALASDVTDANAWYYPYLRYAVSSSMTMIGNDGLLRPESELTRGQVALLLHRYFMYKEGRRTQALLSETETEILVILDALDRDDILQAEFASARGLLAARGAHASKPDLPIVKGALKIMESFRTLIRGYRAGTESNYDEVIRLAGEAWSLADSARQIQPSLGDVAAQVQEIAKNMADSARALRGVPQ